MQSAVLILPRVHDDIIFITEGRGKVCNVILAVVKAESSLCTINSTFGQVAACVHVKMCVKVVVRQLSLKAYQLECTVSKEKLKSLTEKLHRPL